MDVGNFDIFPTTISHPTDQWLHIALVFDAETNNVIGYQDGEIDASQVAGGTSRIVYNYNGNLVIGRSYNYVHNMDRYASVTVDELMFYDRPLNQTEIQSIMTSYGDVNAWKINLSPSIWTVNNFCWLKFDLNTLNDSKEFFLMKIHSAELYLIILNLINHWSKNWDELNCSLVIFFFVNSVWENTRLVIYILGFILFCSILFKIILYLEFFCTCWKVIRNRISRTRYFWLTGKFRLKTKNFFCLNSENSVNISY